MRIEKPYKKKVSSLCTYFRYSGSPSTESQTRPTILRHRGVLIVSPGDGSTTATELASFTCLLSLESDGTGDIALASDILGEDTPLEKHTYGTLHCIARSEF